MSLPATIENNIREKIKSTIGDMIPEEVWDKLVKDLTNQFINVELQKLVNAELTEHFRAKIREEFASPEWQSKWNPHVYGPAASDMVKNILVEAAPMIFANMMGAMAQQVVMRMANDRII